MLRGRGVWHYYDDNGKETDAILVEAGGEICGLSVPKSQWHNSDGFETGTVILECKDGAWEPLGEEDILQR